MRLNARWKRFFFSELDPAPLGLFRIALGVLLSFSFIALYPNWNDYFGPGGMRPEPANLYGWSLFAWTDPWIPIGAFWWLGFLSSLAFTFGWKTRLFTILLFALESSMFHTGVTVVHGDDMVIRMLLFYGIFAPLGGAFSVDARSASRTEAARTSAWPLRLMQINIALIYAFSLPSKLMSDASWRNGEALYWVFMSSLWNRWPIQALLYDATLSRAMTYSTVIVEGLFPILVWIPATRLPILIAIAAFHLGLAILLQGLTFFSLAMVCSFILFIPARNIRQLAALTWRGRKLANASQQTQMIGGENEIQEMVAGQHCWSHRFDDRRVHDRAREVASPGHG